MVSVTIISANLISIITQIDPSLKIFTRQFFVFLKNFLKSVAAGWLWKEAARLNAKAMPGLKN